MKFKYIGANDETRCFNTDFKKGEAVEVTNETAIERLSNNPHFEAIEEAKKDENPLHVEAKALGIKFAKNIGDETLQTKIDEAKAEKAKEDEK